MKKILVLDSIAKEGVDYLKKTGFQVDEKPTLSEGELIHIIPNYHGLLVRSATKITTNVLKNAILLQVIGRAGAGVDNIDIAGADDRGVVVVNAPDGNSVSVAEYTIGMMLSIARQIPLLSNKLRRGVWCKSSHGVELFGKTLGILGLGRIGCKVAKRAKAFEMNIIGHDPYLPKNKVKEMDIKIVSLEDIFCQSDFITLHLPFNQETKYIVDEKLLGIAKPSAFLINVARGGIVDEIALYNALVSKKIAGAAIDVYEEEPAIGNPLLSLDNVIATPHLGASTKEAQAKISMEVAKNVIAVFKNIQSAINVLEKQIFVQPSDVEFAEILGYKTGMCVCGEELVEYETYCWNCGQKINWN